MKLSDVKLPSNRSFGFLFSVIFFSSAILLIINDIFISSYVTFTFGFLFFLIAILKADILLPLNKAWMMFGLLLGRVISPIVLGFIFFGLFTPYSFVMKLFGRDELRLKLVERASHWKERSLNKPETDSFKQQF